MRGKASIRTLLIGTHAFLWVIPLAAVFGLRLLDSVLWRQTERQLIAESVVIGEAFREQWLLASAQVEDEHRPPGHTTRLDDRRYTPWYPTTHTFEKVLPTQPVLTKSDLRPDPHALTAGLKITRLVRRAQTFNLSAVRVLDAQGCVVATSRGEEGVCMSELPEVAHALAGRYASVLRERISDHPPPPFGDIRRRGDVRVFTALPIFSDGRLIGVVRASRTGRDALSSLWDGRRWLVWLGGVVLVSLAFVSFASAAAIARPIQRLTRAATEVEAGAPAQALAVAGGAPSEIVQLHAVLLKMARKLERRADYVQEFASQVSHELKSPITAIRGAAELLAQAEADMAPEDRARFLANILEDAQRMEQLVSKLLTLARLENQASVVSEVIDAVGFARRLLERYGARVELRAPEEPYPLAISSESLASVITNLVDNALRHGGDGRVEVELAREGGRLRIDVRDHGPGVSEANRARLFERFFTTERDRGGTGLGLPIVRAIAEGRGGRAYATFDARGNTFSVIL